MNYSPSRLLILPRTLRVAALGLLLLGGARLLPGQAGTLDTTFDPGGGATNSGQASGVGSVVIQPDGKILVGGVFTQFNGIARNCVARLNPDGNVDPSFNPGTGANGEVTGLALQGDGKVIVVGKFTAVNGFGRNRLARLNQDGSVDQTFVTAGTTRDITAVTIQPSGKIVVAGPFDSAGGVNGKNSLVRFNVDGSLDQSFTSPPYGGNIPGIYNVYSFGDVNALVQQPDGKILMGGAFDGISSVRRTNVARLNPDGSVDQSFGIPVGSNGSGNGGGTVYGLALQSDGKVIVVGQKFRINGNGPYDAVRLNADGSIDLTYILATPNNTGVYGAAVQSDGRAVVSGSFRSINGVPAEGFARINQNGSVDTTFSQGNPASLSGILYAVAIQSDGKFVVGGTFTSFNGAFRRNVARLNAVSVTPPPRLINLATRLRVETGDNVLIGGFVIQGTGTKRVIVRALGPSLPVAGPLADPTLQIVNSQGQTIASNDDWRTSQQAVIQQAGLAPSNDKESAVLLDLPAGAYTAVVRGFNGGQGVGLVEVYDLQVGNTEPARLINIATRGRVQTGDNVMIGGLVVSNGANKRVLFRALGPSLAGAGVANVLADPTVEIVNSQGVTVAANDNWQNQTSGGSAAEITSFGLAPTNPNEAAVIVTLPPGGYTAIVRGANFTTGVALIEAYELP